LIIGCQEWRDLLFLHWRIPVAEVRAHVHPRLAIDERDGSAWISMTPFTLRRGRLRGLPPLPDFHELNFRTYVRGPGGPGIWFFSLDAASAAAVALARLSVRLPYFHAQIDRGEGWYRSDRYGGPGHFEARWSVGRELGRASPGSLEHFLVERYLLYSRAAGPLLWRGPVRHEPWTLHEVDLASVREDLSTTAGLPPLGRPALCQWSPGVAVAFEPFRPG
jgi:uncharacterized protein YqjF (DUF2071 family)